MPPTVSLAPNPKIEATLGKALVRAADRLGITNRTLAAIVGVSEPSLSRLRRGDFLLRRGTKEFELGVLFVRLFRSLDAIVGGDEEVARAWMRNHNIALGDTPLNLVQTIPGLTNVIQYLDARRAVV
jgi:hypothetical protein